MSRYGLNHTHARLWNQKGKNERVTKLTTSTHLFLLLCAPFQSPGPSCSRNVAASAARAQAATTCSPVLQCVRSLKQTYAYTSYTQAFLCHTSGISTRFLFAFSTISTCILPLIWKNTS